MSKSNAFETAFLALILQNANIANLGDATGVRGSSSAGSLYFALHTADPGEAGSAQTTSEVSYTGYSRVAVARSGAGFDVTDDVGSPVADVVFGACTAIGAPISATHFSIGVAGAGSGLILWRGALTPAIGIDVGVTPIIDSGTTITES